MKKFSPLFGVVLSLLLNWATPAHAFDYYLKIDGIDGDVSVPLVKNGNVVLSFSHGVSQAAGATQGSAVFDDFKIFKPLDSASPLLALNCLTGAKISTVSLFGLGTDLKSARYRVNLTNARITSTLVGGSTGGQQPTETVTFSYERIEWI